MVFVRQEHVDELEVGEVEVEIRNVQRIVLGTLTYVRIDLRSRLGNVPNVYELLSDCCEAEGRLALDFSVV